MKKAITSLMLIFTLLFSSSISVEAAVESGVLLTPSSIFEGTGSYYDEITATSKDISIYAVTDADSNVTVDITMDGTTIQYVLYPREHYVHYYNSDGMHMGYFRQESDSLGSLWFNIDRYYGTLTMVSTADFTGTKVISDTTMSSTGEYMVVIGGSISGTFEAGRHQVTNVTSQPLSIFIVNQTNGATRLMTATTINSMYVTVSGGQITKIEINGRAQTTPGNFDTYSIVI